PEEVEGMLQPRLLIVEGRAVLHLEPALDDCLVDAQAIQDRERRRQQGLADVEARERLAFDEEHAAPGLCEEGAGGRAGRSAAAAGAATSRPRPPRAPTAPPRGPPGTLQSPRHHRADGTGCAAAPVESPVPALRAPASRDPLRRSAPRSPVRSRRAAARPRRTARPGTLGSRTACPRA